MSLPGQKQSTEQELQPPSGGPTSTSGDTKLGLQPEENNPSQEGNTDQTLQPPTGPSGHGSADDRDVPSTTSDTKNPVKKVMNFMRDEGEKQSEGPPGMGNE